MNRSYLYIIISAIILTFTACEDVVEVDITKSDPQLCIDAVITNTGDSQMIYISKSIAYFDNSGKFPPVNVDSVVLSDSKGKKYYFSLVDDGKYSYVPSGLDSFEIGENYILKIFKNSDIYSAVSTMYRSTEIDSITSEFYESLDGFLITMYSRDLAGVGDNYWIKTYRNGEFMNNPGKINIGYDGGFEQAFSDSQLMAFPISFMQINDFSKPYKLGEKVKIEILGVSPQFYEFFMTAQGQIQNGGMFATPPVNIRSNFHRNNNNAMTPVGFFNICELKSMEIEIEE